MESLLQLCHVQSFTFKNILASYFCRGLSAVSKRKEQNPEVLMILEDFAVYLSHGTGCVTHHGHTFR